MLERFESFLTYEKRFSEHTVKAYMSDVRSLLEHCGVDPHAVTRMDVRDWLSQMVSEGASPRSVNRRLSSARRFFRYARSQDPGIKDPTQALSGPKTPRRLPEYVQERHVPTAPEACDDLPSMRDKLVIELLYQCGLRCSEVVSLKDGDIQQDHMRIRGKGSKDRLVPISEDFFHFIQTYRQLRDSTGMGDADSLVVSNKGGKCYAKLVYKVANSYLKSVPNVSRRSPHTLRHTFATHLLDNGAPLKVISELLGHSSLVATQVYTHNSTERLKRLYNESHPRGRG